MIELKVTSIKKDKGKEHGFECTNDLTGIYTDIHQEFYETLSACDCLINKLCGGDKKIMKGFLEILEKTLL